MPLVDKPIIQYVVEELVGAGITDIIIVSNYSKRSIEDHFDVPSAELTMALTASGKQAQLDEVRRISDMANFVYVRQKEPLGNAAPLLYSSHLLKGDPFIYAFADDFFVATPSRFQQMIDVYEKTGGAVTSCKRLESDEEYDRYGVIGGEQVQDGLIKMQTIVEKPGKANAPSNLGSFSSYLFTPDILTYVQKIYDEYDGQDELKIQTAMQQMIDDGHPYYGLEIADGTYYDAGNKLEYVKTVVDFALKRDDIGDDFREYLRSKVQ
jgi:UTP--glucose-1-phosphate uridylyltransferase